MKFIQQLDEAARIPISQLKAALKKDPRVKMALSRDVNLDKIDPETFTRTMNYYFFNNPEVLDYVKTRGSGKHFSPFWFGAARKIDPKVATIATVKEIIDVLQDFFKDASASERRKLSADTLEELSIIHNTPNRSRGMSSHALRELAAIDGIRPSSPVRLYRGLMFDKNSLTEYEKYDGTLNVGQGLQFLQSVREGKRVVDLSWDRTSSWTSSLERAMQYAFHGSRGSYVTDTKLAGELGFVISTLAAPEDVVIDLNLAAEADIYHGEKDTVILKAGKYTCRISKKFTPKGEVDPLENKADDEDTVGALAQSLKLFGRILDKKLTPEMQQFAGAVTGGFLHHFMEHAETFREFTTPEMEEKILQLYDTWLEFFKSEILPIDKDSLTDLAGGKHKHAILAIRELQKNYDVTNRLKSRVTKDNVNGFVRKYDITGKEQLGEYKQPQIAEMISHLAKMTRTTDSGVASQINDLAALVGGTRISELHRKGIAVQQPQMEKALEAIYKLLGKPQPKSNADAALEAFPLIKRALGLQRITSALQDIKLLLTKIDSK